MEMKQVKIQDIQGRALDWLVAKAEGLNPNTDPQVRVRYVGYMGFAEGNGFGYAIKRYSTDWAHGGSIVERENIGVWWDGEWHAKYNGCFDVQDAQKPLVAAMRCHVASKMGDVVEVPASLL